MPDASRFRFATHRLGCSIVVALAISPIVARSQAIDTQPIAPTLDGLGPLHHPVQTQVAGAQRFFDQGLRLLYAFNFLEADRAFREAARLDEDYIAQCRAQGVCPVAYYPHNIHFLWSIATIEGRSDAALDAARKVAAKVPHHLAGQLSWTHEFPVIPLFALARFGKWTDILSEPKPAVETPYPNAIWHYARALARTARGERDAAAAELAGLEAERRKPVFEKELSDTPLGSNLEIAIQEVRAELAASHGDLAAAIDEATTGVAIQDAQAYNEPEPWHRPVRLLLGALLLEAGRAGEAETVYREDLARHPETGWALVGLRQSLWMQGRSTDAAPVDVRYQRAWARADVELTGSRVTTPLAHRPGGAAVPAPAPR